MKGIRPLLVVMALAVITLGLSGYALAFHDGGVAHCDGCHSMHSSPEKAFTLLIASDVGSTCLDCHQGGWGFGPNYHVFSSDGSVQSPGGDFFWLTQNYSVDVGWTVKNFNGYDKGHNIVASDFGLNAGDDGDNTTAPGSTVGYLQANLSCNSCHNPHGGGGTDNLSNPAAQLPISGSGSYGGTPPTGTRFGNYRLLYDQDDDDPVPGIGTISIDAPQAVTIGYIETDSSHPAYQSGMSDYCGLCHDQFLPGGGSNDKHPVNEALGTEHSQNYNFYRATGDYASSNSATAYLPLVAYEEATVSDPQNTAGPSANAEVACITCHRSHASAFDFMARWQLDTEFLADQIPTTTEVPAMADDTVPYYGRDIVGGGYFGTQWQRQLCNKCHVQD